MSDFKVLFLYPNQRTESLLPPAVAVFTRLLKDIEVDVRLFDSTNYDLDADDYTDTNFIRQTDRKDNKGAVQNLLVRPYESRAESLRKHIDATAGLRQAVEEFQPHLIAVTVTESTFLLATHLLKAISDFDIPNIFGGVFTTFAPEFALRFPEVKMVCVGEGENCLVDLCQKMREGKDYSKVTNLWIKGRDGSIIKNPITRPVDINEIPRPDYSLFEEGQFYRPMYGQMYKMIPIETHRGCPYTCAFCNSPAQNVLYSAQTSGHFFRKRSMEKIRDDLLHYRDELGMEYVYFWADTFLAWSPREFEAFCEMYQDIKLPFWCQTRVETADENKFQKLQDVGLHFMTFGMEHGNEEFRARVVKRKYPNELAIDALKIPKNLGIPFAVNNIIGFPDETRELSMDTIDINRHFQSDQMSCSIFQPYMGTELRPICEKKGYIHPDTICPANSDNTVMTLPDFSSQELLGLKRTFAMYVKFPTSRWADIQLAEKLTPDGDKMWAKLSEEFKEQYMSTPDSDITRQGNPAPDEDSSQPHASSST